MFKSERRFRLWDYNVSLGQALIRSPISPGLSTNVDLIFWGVEFISVPTTIDGLAIYQKDIELVCSLGEHSQVFAIRTNGQEYVCAALVWKVYENKLELIESPIREDCSSGSQVSLGTVLATSDQEELNHEDGL